MSALAIVTAMNREDAKVPRAIRKVLPQIAKAVDLVAQRLAAGGRLIYVGSGTRAASARWMRRSLLRLSA